MRLKIIDLLIVIGIMTMVTMGWQLLELIMSGKVIENESDSVICLLLTFSIFKNIKSYSKKG